MVLLRWRALLAAKSCVFSRLTGLLRRSPMIFTTWSKRQWPLGSIWRGTEKIRIQSSGWFWWRAGFTVWPVTIRRPRSFHQCGNSKTFLSFLLFLFFILFHFLVIICWFYLCSNGMWLCFKLPSIVMLLFVLFFCLVVHSFWTIFRLGFIDITILFHIKARLIPVYFPSLYISWIELSFYILFAYFVNWMHRFQPLSVSTSYISEKNAISWSPVCVTVVCIMSRFLHIISLQ